MTGFFTDENFNGILLKAVRRHAPDVDLLRVQDTEVYSMDDPAVLEFATRQGRVLLSHDVKTMIGFHAQRVAAGIQTCGLIEVARFIPALAVVFDIQLIAELSEPGEWDNRVEYLPL